MHVELVKKCIQHLMYYGLIKMIDIFQYSNMYSLQSKHIMLQLFRDKTMQEECLSFVIQEEGSNTAPSAQMHDILKLYCAMKPGSSLSQILTEHQSMDTISIINPR